MIKDKRVKKWTNRKLTTRFISALTVDLCPATIEQSVEEGVKGGCTVIQLREKDCTSREFYELAVRVKKITDKYNVPLIINDRLDIAQAVDCAGVHLGQSDMPCAVARKILGEDKIIGISAATLEEAKKAQADGLPWRWCNVCHQHKDRRKSCHKGTTCRNKSRCGYPYRNNRRS